MNKILVCGGRSFDDYELLNDKLNSICIGRGWCTNLDADLNWVPRVEIIQGGAKGADALADKWAVNGWCKVHEFPPLPENIEKWGYGTACLMRNQQMLDEGKPDLVVAFPGGRGTKDMIERAGRNGYECIIVAHIFKGLR